MCKTTKILNTQEKLHTKYYNISLLEYHALNTRYTKIIKNTEHI